ncbi:MAG TPA: phospholipase domain-containing protein [Gryllotalpicola sp.]
MSHRLSDIRHLVFITVSGGADGGGGIPGGIRAELERRATECVAYHLVSPDEDRAALWAGYGAELTAAGHSVTLGQDAAQLCTAFGSGALPELTTVETDAAGLRAALEALESAPELAASALVAVEVRAGESLPVVDAQGSLGAPGTLWLFSPWSPGGWVSEEVLDHTSLLQLCERWTADRGEEVRAILPAWRRAVCGELLSAIELRGADEVGPLPEIDGRRFVRPVPYFPVVDLRVDDGAVLLLSNIGPMATRSVNLRIDDGVSVTHHTVPGVMREDAVPLEVPVAVRDGRYDVTVLGPNHFRRRFAGSLPSTVRCRAEHFATGDPRFPTLTLAVSHELKLPVFFRLEHRLGERASDPRFASGVFERYPGPRQTLTFHESPATTTYGWYEFAVTTPADEGWIQEYAGQLPSGAQVSISY